MSCIKLGLFFLSMGVITVKIPDKIEIALRRLIREKYGKSKEYKKGMLSRGVTEALVLWITSNLNEKGELVHNEEQEAELSKILDEIMEE